MAVELYVIVSGGSTWPCKPRRWTAHLRLGPQRGTFYDRKYAHSCKSLADACRKAEKLPFLDEEVRALLKKAYSPVGAEAVYRETKEGGFEPLVTRLHLDYGGDRDLPVGKFWGTCWTRPWMGPDKGKLVVSGSYYNHFGGGWTGGTYSTGRGPIDMDLHHELVRRVGCWLPQPVEE